MRALLVLVVAAALITGAAPPQTAAASVANTREHYVDCSSRTSGDGTRSRPWNSIATALQHLTFGPDDRLLFKRGTACRGQVAPKGNGSPGHPAILGAWGHGARPTISGGGTASWNGTIQLVDQQHWTVQDLHITNTAGGRSSPSYRSGVFILNRTDARLSGITVQRLALDSVTSNMSNDGAGPRSFGGISILTVGGVTGGFDHALVRDNDVQRVGRTGIIVSNNSYPAGHDAGTRITHNRVSRVRGDGIVLLGTRRGRMDHNVSAYAAQEWPCAECGEISRFTANAAIWTGSSDRVRIDHNEAYGTKALGGDGEGFDIDSYATNTVVEYNYAHDNEGGGIFFCGSTRAIARFNILQNNGKSAFAFIGTAPARNSMIANNTVYISSSVRARPVRYFNGAFPTKITFKNNLVINHSLRDWAWPAKPRTSSNTIVGRHGSGRPTDGRTSRRDPALKDAGSGRIGFGTLKGYKPTSPTTLLRGAAIPSTVTRDFFGKKINPAKPPRGAAG